jgi:uncharacterized lipoprotein YddW (UPF0748 family)
MDFKHRFRWIRSIFSRTALIALLCYTGCRQSDAQELRGTWIARDYLGSRDLIARAMDSLAANNFNTVMVNVWSRGYPLYQSELFLKHTGISIDPNYAGRDVLQEAIAEGHRAGLHVEAWFEYGFVGGYSGYLPGTGGKGKIFDLYPHWVAKQQNGTEIDGSSFYWMVHTRPDVQDFLIGMAAEVARKYDVDGIELDRVRYSSLNYGYDPYTDSLYKAEHGGQPIPAPSDTSWRRWRADKLNQFVARAYDSIKAVNPNVNVSNAPSLYSSTAYSSYDSFCQDWVWWVNNHKVDNVHVQSYVSSPSTFGAYMDNMIARVSDKTRVHPSFAIKPNGTPIGAGTATQLIDVTRAKGLTGNSIWYFTDLIGTFPELKAGRYAAKVHPPHSSSDWRAYVAIVTISDTLNARRSGSWTASASPGYKGPSIYAGSSGVSTVEYSLNVPVNGYYEVYAYSVTSSNRTASAPFTVHTEDGTISATVDQSKTINSGWRKLADARLSAGMKKVVTLSNTAIGDGKLVSADAVMIVLNRRLTPVTGPAAVKSGADAPPRLFGLLQNYPNPFNPVTTLHYTIPDGASAQPVTLTIYDMLGRSVTQLVNGLREPGTHSVQWNASENTSGIYFAKLTAGSTTHIRKLTLLK